VKILREREERARQKRSGNAQTTPDQKHKKNSDAKRKRDDAVGEDTAAVSVSKKSKVESNSEHITTTDKNPVKNKVSSIKLQNKKKSRNGTVGEKSIERK
jgi:hypothetical protein